VIRKIFKEKGKKRKNAEGNENSSIINFMYATVPRLVLNARPTTCGIFVKNKQTKKKQ